MSKRKLVYGVGINDANYIVKRREKVNGKWKIVWECPYYSRWSRMLERCYSKKYQERCPTYIGCTVCEEWLAFSNFKKWMEQQEWEDRQLDKDFLIEDNKIYSPDACVFIPSKLNNFIITNGRSRGIYPLGVCYEKKSKRMVNERSKPYVGMINNQRGKILRLGYYSTTQEAHQAYLRAKLKQCENYLEEFKDEVLVVKGLTRIRDKIQYHIENNLELTLF